MLWDDKSTYVPVALLDDDPTKRNLTVRGVRVIGDRSALRTVAALLLVRSCTNRAF